jgi:Tfp pilus tip-associated adhesin PilY1
MNNKTRYSLITLLSGLLAFAQAGAQAADIDIYSSLTNGGAPNVLIVMDNAANFDAATTAAPCIINGATNTMAKTATTNSAGGIEQCALYNVISQLPTNPDGTARVNIGFMIYNANGMKDYNLAVCGGTNGGCLAYPLQGMTASTKATLLTWIAGWTPQTIKVNNEAVGATMAEAWAYYAGQKATFGSGNDYSPLGKHPQAGCQKNFLIFLANVYSSSAHPSDSPGTALPALTDPTNGAYALTGATQPTPMPILGSQTTSCGAYTFSATNHENNGMYGDEWARFMYNTDIFSGTSGTQNIVTYTVGLVGPTCPTDYPALLANMARYGGGKYFATSDSSSIVQAILSILNEVQAVNSVFSAATLPVSVNAQGTYLNQIYMGMFRPDANANPRWVGNLKQYQMQFDANKNLYLADATGQPAISTGGTGFITPGAASFWTCTDTTRATTLAGPVAPYAPYSTLAPCNVPSNTAITDPTSGFWASHPSYPSVTTGQAWDLQDGEIVEKGGAAQQLRLTNQIASYPTGTAATPDSPRLVYTWCPGDPQNASGACIADLTNPVNSFSNGNAAITASMFGTGLNMVITGITRVGTTATATTSGATNIAVGTSVTISGATPAEYNGTVTVTSSNGNRFSYTVPEWPPTPATTTTTGGVGGYVATPLSAVSIPLSSLSRVAAGTAVNATVTGVTSTPNSFISGSNVTISGATPSNYNLTQAVTVVNTTTFTYPVAVQPTPTPTGPYVAPLTTGSIGNYVVSLAGASPGSVTAANCTASTKVVNITVTGTGYTFRVGDFITISGDTQAKTLNGGYYVTAVSGTGLSFITTGSCPGSSPSSGTQVVAGPPAALPLTSLTRNETVVGAGAATATIGATTGVGNGNYFTSGDLVVISNKAGTTVPSNETGYLATAATINCINVSCTQFSYSIVTTPAQQTGTTATAAGAIPGQTISSLTRPFPGGTLATAVLAGAIGYADGSTVAIQTAPGTTLAAHEGAYVGTWTITCVPAGTSPCTTFTFGPLALTPVTPATGAISGSSPGVNPDRSSLINWVRGQDNYGDEPSLCPGGALNAVPGANYTNCPTTPVTIRPSVHGDTLHSRPIAVNYGAMGTVVFYGTNDGLYHAVNGNQTASVGTVQPGAELWSFIAPDFFDKLNRQRTDSPALLLPSTPPGIIPTPQPKDYFFDGPTGLYTTRDASGNITKAIIYIAARRGGHFIYAMDVTNPLKPLVLWRISSTTPGFAELGQTWSLPQVAPVAGYANPVLFFGAGYDDGAEDAEPPTADSMGRGIFAVDALTGALLWNTQPNPLPAGYAWWRTMPNNPGSTCTTNNTVTPAQTTCQVNGMTYSIAADLTLVDRNSDGKVDRLYAVDVGGNVWRVDLEPAAGNTPDKWQVTQLAQLGDEGQAVFGASFGLPVNALYWMFSGAFFPAATPPYLWNGNTALYGTPRKFLYRAGVMFAPSGYNYDVVLVGSGDREHPLAAHQASGVINRVYMLKDFNMGNDSVSQTIPYLEQYLDDCTGTAINPNTCSMATTGATSPLSYDKLTQTQQRRGFYITLKPGEKVVNQPLEAGGLVYFATNQPAPQAPNSCATNLGTATGYAMDPFTGAYYSHTFDVGGLPPSAVAGVVQIGTQQALFCIGCVDPGSALGQGGSGIGGGACNSADCSRRLRPKVPATRSRTFWYTDGK